MGEQDVRFERVGDVDTGWGESVIWDDRRDRLFWVDCMASSLYWLEDGSSEPDAFELPSMPTGIVPTDDGLLLAVLGDGIHVVDVDRHTTEHLAPNPPGITGRCNDACADLDGNLITGKLNTKPAPGSAWQFSVSGGWTMLDDDIANTNGPQVFGTDGEVLVIGDTSAHYYAYDYDSAMATADNRRIIGDVSDVDGIPDGSTMDDAGGLWCALVQGGQLARFADGEPTRTVAVPCTNPTDVTFGGPELDRLYVVSIGGQGDLDGALLVADGVATGRPEPRFTL